MLERKARNFLLGFSAKVSGTRAKEKFCPFGYAGDFIVEYQCCGPVDAFHLLHGIKAR